jgi:hypothetical protein
MAKAAYCDLCQVYMKTRHLAEIPATVKPRKVKKSDAEGQAVYAQEQQDAFESKILRAGDVRDPESFKVRRGKVGGYEEYLSPKDQEYAKRALRRLDDRFGYAE